MAPNMWVFGLRGRLQASADLYWPMEMPMKGSGERGRRMVEVYITMLMGQGTSANGSKTNNKG
jgi:hypothetical protein